MSLLIKGMDMPEHGCTDCDLFHNNYGYYLCPIIGEDVRQNVESGNRHINCPLVEIPTLPADVAPVVHGEWLKKGQTLYMCSKCGRVIDAYSDLSKTVENFPYCHCGARMFVWKTNGEVKDGF